MSEEIIVRQDGRVLRITLNRPDSMVSEPMALELTGLLRNAGATSDIVVLTGAGADFCAGRAPGGAPPGQMDAYEMREKREVIFNCYDSFRQAVIPVIGVVRGKAHGLGCALAGLCDITLAAADSSFRIPEMAQGVLPTMVLSALHDRVPPKALAYLLYSTAEITPAEAITFGIASRVVPTASLDQELAALLAVMGKQPRPALLGGKEFIGAARSLDPHNAVRFAQSLHGLVNTSSGMKKK